MLYQDSLETTNDLPPDDHDSGNEADTEPDSEEECLWEMNPIVTSIDKLDVNNIAEDEGECFINEDLDLAYSSGAASESVPSDTSTSIDSDPLYAMHALASLHAPVRSSFMTRDREGDVHGAFFEVPAKYEGQRPILFGRVESEPIARENSGSDSEFPQFFQHGPALRNIMEKMGYDLVKRHGLNFGKGRRALPRSYVPKGKPPNYYNQTGRGPGYVSTPTSLDQES